VNDLVELGILKEFIHFSKSHSHEVSNLT
jgi:hypothetical protein